MIFLHPSQWGLLPVISGIVISPAKEINQLTTPDQTHSTKLNPLFPSSNPQDLSFVRLMINCWD
jgi:hypothetical protein